MKIEIHHYHHYEDSTLNKTIERLVREVTEMRSAVDGAALLLNKLGQMIRDAGTDEKKLEELASSLDEGGQALAQAVVTNTPSDGEPEALVDEPTEGTPVNPNPTAAELTTGAATPNGEPAAEPVVPTFPDGSGAVPKE